MKKFIVLTIGILFLAGCGGQTEKVTCNIGGKEAIFTLKNGIIDSYNFNGAEITQSKIDEINGTYFTSATNNEEGKNALKNYVNSVNGSCK